MIRDTLDSLHLPPDDLEKIYTLNLRKPFPAMNHHRLLVSFILVGVATLLAADRRTVAAEFAVQQKPDRVIITDAGRPVATYVFRDDKILRPYFANVHAPGGIQVTRNHPPVPGKDATDHDTMHPGVWLAFGNLSGQDFWRQRGQASLICSSGTGPTL